jgi:hypothetical protein
MASRSAIRREKTPVSEFIHGENAHDWVVDESHLEYPVHHGHRRNRIRNVPSRAYQHQQAT